MLLFLLATVAVTALAAVTDFKTGRIPNGLTLGGLVFGIAGHCVYGFVTTKSLQVGLFEGGASIVGALFCSLAPAFMYWKGGMGGGDLKLFAAIGALCHPMLGIEIQMYSLLAAAVAAQAKLAYEGRLLRTLGGSFALLLNPFLPRDKRRAPPAETMVWFRMGPAIFVGALVALIAHAYALKAP